MNHPGALRKIFSDPSSELRIGEANIYDEFDIQGDIEAVYPIAEFLAEIGISMSEKLRLGWELRKLPKG